MAWVAPAIGAAGSILGGITGGKGASAAAKAQAQSQANALAEQQREFGINQQNFAPYLAAGTNALSGAGNILGLNGTDAQQAAINGIQASPFFTSQDQAGQDALLQAASATGGLRGGNTEAALYNQRSSLLASAIQNRLAGLTGVASMGVGAAGTVGGLGQNNANAQSGIYSNIGNINASGSLAGAANTNQIINGLTSSLTSGIGAVQRNNYTNGAASLGSYYSNPISAAGLVTPNFSW